MADTSAADRVVDALKEHDPELITTNLSKEQEEKLRHAFEEEDQQSRERFARRWTSARPASGLITGNWRRQSPNGLTDGA